MPCAVRAHDTAALPAVVDRVTWQAELDQLRAREKAHTREGDSIAAARRRLPMVEVDPTLTLIGPDGAVPLLECSRAADSSSPGTSCGSTASRLPRSVRAARSSTARSANSRNCMRATSPTPCSPRARTKRASATATSWAGTYPGIRRETPPAPCSPAKWQAGTNPFRTDGRPTAQWSRLQAGHSDDLGTHPTGS
jgi:hypothetical protein